MKTMQLNKITSAIAISMMVSGAAVAGIGGSKHDLGANGASQLGATNGLGNTTEVCVFCHTPHGADSTRAVPLWNKSLPDGSGYQRYSSLGTATLDGEESVNVGSVSIACLSCHDGTQAMDAVINAPGSGLGTTPGTAKMTGTPVPMLGTDLRDDHPVSIQYAGGACNGVNAACDPGAQATGDPDFNTAQHAAINGGNYWWVDTAAGTAAQRDKTDMILYTRSDWNGADAGTNGPSVECASCHDPHNAETGVAANSVSFMRVVNSDSQVCLACHIK